MSGVYAKNYFIEGFLVLFPNNLLLKCKIIEWPGILNAVKCKVNILGLCENLKLSRKQCCLTRRVTVLSVIIFSPLSLQSIMI